MDNFYMALEVLGKGMLAIFIVITVIFLVIKLFNIIDRRFTVKGKKQ